jgi:hypothetical protein
VNLLRDIFRRLQRPRHHPGLPAEALQLQPDAGELHRGQPGDVGASGRPRAGLHCEKKQEIQTSDNSLHDFLDICHGLILLRFRGLSKRDDGLFDVDSAGAVHRAPGALDAGLRVHFNQPGA